MKILDLLNIRNSLIDNFDYYESKNRLKDFDNLKIRLRS